MVCFQMKGLLLLLWGLAVHCSPMATTQRSYRKDGTEIDRAYDYVIIGGGTSGNVIANRLTEDPKSQLKIPSHLTLHCSCLNSKGARD